MYPVNFPGAVEIKKPDNMTDEQCTSIWARYGLSLLSEIKEEGISVPPSLFTDIDSAHFNFFLTAWKPNKEDLEALNRGEPIYIKTLTNGLPPMAVFTLDKNGEGNF